MEIFVKNVKLINNCKAIVKSKWCNDTVKLSIFVSDDGKENWKIYRGQCDPLNIEYEKIKDYLTLKSNTDSIMFDIIGREFIIFMKEYLGSDSEGYADIIYFKLPLDCEEISMDIVLEQISEINRLTSIISHANETIKTDQESMRKIKSSLDKLLIEKQEFEKKFYSKAAALFNTKKKYIQDNVYNKISNLNISHDAGTSEELLTKNKKLEEKIYSSPSRTPSKRQSLTPRRTPIKGMQRTPSKRLREIQDMSDSDDSFTVLSCDTNKKLTSKPISNSLDSSRVFKDFKIKTPIKKKEYEKRESSVELKIDRRTNEIIPDESENEQKSLESKSSNQQNAQQMEVDNTIIDDEVIPCSQESQEMALSVTSFSERLSRNKQKKRKTENSININPYNVNTVNILDISD
ncbi:hypothetical protein ACKWTF_008010 [Chironomus riparius]